MLYPLSYEGLRRHPTVPTCVNVTGMGCRLTCGEGDEGFLIRGSGRAHAPGAVSGVRR
jgi:hypothetical protein